MVARSGGPTKDARDGVVDKELLGAFRSQNPKHVEERARYFKPVPGLANQRIQCKECAGGTKFFDGLGELFGHCKSIQDANKGGRRSSQHGAMAVFIAIDLLKCRDATQSAVSRATLHCVRPASASAQSSRQQQHPHNVVTFSHRLAWPPMVISTGFCYHEPDRTDMRAKAASAEDVFLLYNNRGEFTGAVLAVFKSSLDGYRAAREWEREEDAETKKELVIFDDIMKIEKQLRLPTVKKNQLRKRLLETEVVTLKDIDRMEEEEREAKRRREGEEAREAERRRAEEEERVRKRKREEEEEEAERKREREDEEAARKRKREEEEEAAARARECNVCFDEMEDGKRAVLSCGHAKTCYGCAIHLWDTTRQCPECRATIEAEPRVVYL
ncbi:hypothetical protein PPROV_000784900 [Pycnococcus provasolii]|uniref:RING-type domain-containing protein n=1 Tax=Pycnococcus provasolii TaxID=41880 RepID=A0A830HQ55_9CHLO|nr:hypothetical protein PPROV_000784900 [Pycnococcus provasolii]